MIRGLLIFAVLPALAQPIVSNVRTDYVPAPDGSAPHSYMRVRWNLDGPACYHRLQFGKTTSYGNTVEAFKGTYTCAQNDVGVLPSGLAPSTTYHFCPQSSTDGSTWSACTDYTFTTGALPAQHPAPPQVPALWTPAFPDTSGYAVYNMNNSCVDAASGLSLQQDINLAVQNQPTNGTMINIPNEASTANACPNIYFPPDTQALNVPMNSTGVNTTTGVLTPSNSVSGWTPTNGQTVMITGYGSGACLPGSLTGGNDNNSYNGSGGGCGYNGQFLAGQVYYLVGVSGSSFQLSLTQGGSPVIPADTGTSCSNCAMLVEQFPHQNSNWIIIQTSTPDSQFAPQGVRAMHSVWQSKMAHIQMPGGCYYCQSNPFSFVGSTGNFAYSTFATFNHHIWFRGIDFDDSAQTFTSVDQRPTSFLLFGNYSFLLDNIVIDRSYLHCGAFPNRCTSIIGELGGSNIAVMNSDLSNWNYWHPSATPTIYNSTTYTAGSQGWSGTITSQTLTIIPGSAMLGPLNTCTSTANVTFTASGLASGAQTFVYVDSSCAPTMVAPTGTTGLSCTGSMTDSSSVSHPCTTSTAASPNWPLDTNGGYNCYTLGTIQNNSGTFSWGTNPYGYSHWLTEGTQGWQAGQGPGPFTVWNNYVEGSGLLMHWDDGSAIDPQNVWIRQNTFFWDQSHRLGSPTSNGYWYGNRNGPEFKHGRSIKVDGNLIDGMFSSVSLAGPAMLFHTTDYTGTVGTQSPPWGYTVQDVDITNNTCLNSSACFEVGMNPNSVAAVPAAARIRVQNNIMQTNGFSQTDGITGNASLQGGGGQLLELDGGMEDLIIDHNTLFNSVGNGNGPTLWHSQSLWTEGCQVTNNIWWFTTANYGITSEYGAVQPVTPAIGGTGSALFNSYCTSDPSTPGGIMSNNVAVPSYSNFSNPASPSGVVSAQSICTNFGGGTISGNNCPGGLIGTILNGASAAANLAAIGFQDPAGLGTDPLALKLSYGSPFISRNRAANDGTDMGANVIGLLTAQGAVQMPQVINITSSSATVSWRVYDPTIACPVDYAVAPNDASSQTGGGRLTPAASGNVHVVLSGLSSGTQYNYRVLCPTQQPAGSFQTQ